MASGRKLPKGQCVAWPILQEIMDCLTTLELEFEVEVGQRRMS